MCNINLVKNRHQIQALLEAGHNQAEIADIIDVNRSTINRELQHNVANSSSTGNDYRAEIAQQLTDPGTNPNALLPQLQSIYRK